MRADRTHERDFVDICYRFLAIKRHVTQNLVTARLISLIHHSNSRDGLRYSGHGPCPCAQDESTGRCVDGNHVAG